MYENFSTIKRTLYLKSHFRRPVQFVGIWGLEDVQGAIPPGWCDVCGAEAWQGNLCVRCRDVLE